MGAIKSTTAYTEHYNILLDAFARGGLILEFPTEARAKTWQHSANACRRIDRLNWRERHDRVGGSKLDTLIIRVPKERPTTVIIEPRRSSILTIKDLNGEAVEVQRTIEEGQAMPARIPDEATRQWVKDSAKRIGRLEPDEIKLAMKGKYLKGDDPVPNEGGRPPLTPDFGEDNGTS